MIKKLTFLFIISICISVKSNAMETITVLVKNEVAPAAAIMVAGAAIGTAHKYAFHKVSSYFSSTNELLVPPAQIKKGAIHGAFLSIPVILASRFGAPTAYAWPNMVKFGSLLIGALTIPSLTAAYDQDYKMYSPVVSMSKYIDASLVTPREASFYARKEKEIEKKVFSIQLFSSLVSAGALLTKWLYT